MEPARAQGEQGWYVLAEDPSGLSVEVAGYSA